MTWPLPRPTARPLTVAEAAELVDEDCADVLVLLGGELYDKQDLYGCDGRGCDVTVPDRSELDEDQLCGHCAREAREWQEHQRQLESDYRRSVL